MSDLKPFPYVTFTPEEIAAIQTRRRYSKPVSIENYRYAHSVRRFILDELPIGSKVNLLGEEAMVTEHNSSMFISMYDSATILYRSATGGLGTTSLGIEALAALKGYEAPVPPWRRPDYERPEPEPEPEPAQPTSKPWRRGWWR